MRRAYPRLSPSFLIRDTSVVGWQLMALQSAKTANLTVPGETMEFAGAFLDSVASEGGARYGYQRGQNGTPAMTAEGFRKMVRRAGESAGLPFSVHPHMIRHACGYKLANEGKDTRAIQLYMGHKNIQNTVGYTQLSAARFKDFWVD